jgi:hypothetical protein
MPIQSSAIIEGTTVGVVGSVLFAALTIARDQLKVWSFKRKLRAELRSTGCGSGIRGITTRIDNLTGAEFTVREIAMVTDRAVLLFNATGEVKSCVKPKKDKLTQEQRTRIAKGEAVEVGPPEVQFRPWRVGIGDGGFVTVKPYTSHEFLLPAELAAGSDAIPQHLRITVEHKGWMGDTEITQETTTGFAAESLKQIFEQFRSGPALENLNKARLMFRLPPVQPAQREAAVDRTPIKPAGTRAET